MVVVEIVAVVVAAVALVAGVIGCVLTARAIRRVRGPGGRHETIVAQYEPPADAPPLVAAPLLRIRRRRASAQIVHLAVIGAIRIEEGHAPGEPALRLMDAGAAAGDIDRRSVELLFPSGTAGELRIVSRASRALAQTMRTLVLAGERETERLGYLVRLREPVARAAGTVAVSLLVPLLVALVIVLGANPVAAIVPIVLGVAALVLGIVATARRVVPTPRGAAAIAHLRGLKEFITIAERDRIAMLQGRAGAERLPDGSVSVVRLYERLLPYAMLFGLEREWARVLEVRYREESLAPVWFPLGGESFDAGAFDSAAFDSTFGGFADSVDGAAGDGGGGDGGGGDGGGGDGGG